MDTDGETMDVECPAEAWAAVRRNPRDLAGVLEAMRAAAAPSAEGPANQVYQKLTFSRQFEGYVSDHYRRGYCLDSARCKRADPIATELTAVADKIRTKIEFVLKTADAVRHCWRYRRQSGRGPRATR